MLNSVFCVLYSMLLIYLSMLVHFNNGSVTMDLLYNFKPSIIIPRIVCFPRDTCGIWVPLYIPRNFRIVFSLSVKNIMGSLMGTE